jgi:hypothetical protein
MNVAILRGRLSSPPRQQELRSGDLLVSLEVTTGGEKGQKASVPVAWFSKVAPPKWDTGTEVVIVGTVRRRFFRPGGGGTASRTEVVADQVLVASRGSRIAKHVEAAIVALDELAHPPGADGASPRPARRRRAAPPAPAAKASRSTSRSARA